LSYDIAIFYNLQYSNLFYLGVLHKFAFCLGGVHGEPRFPVNNKCVKLLKKVTYIIV
jgi:hypothetical protein